MEGRRKPARIHSEPAGVKPNLSPWYYRQRPKLYLFPEVQRAVDARDSFVVSADSEPLEVRVMVRGGL